MIRLNLNIDMPENCIDCPFNCECMFCLATEDNRELLYEDDYHTRREEWCPLEEVKQE